MDPRRDEAEGRAHDDNRGALDRALDLLEALVAQGHPASLAELATKADLPKPTTHRIVQAFIARNYARQEDDGRYSPGSMLLTLSGQLSEALDLADHAKPIMRSLQSKLPETVHLGLLEGDHAVYVAKLDGLRQILMASRVGNLLALHSTAIGKAILAFLPSSERTALVARIELSRRTPRTIVTMAGLEREIELVHDRGYAIDDEENEEQIRCVGAPVFDRRGRVIGGLSLSAPAFAMPIEMAHLLGPSVLAAASELSTSLGAPSSALPGQGAIARNASGEYPVRA